MSQIVVVGASFAGLTAALELRRLLPASDTVTVVSASERFYFLASLIWVVQGWREIDEISFPVQPVLDEAGIEFVHARLVGINPTEDLIRLDDRQVLSYDRLLITTGGEWNWDSAPGLAPRPKGHTVSILSPQDALNARPYWQALLESPGPVVIGAMPNSGLYGAAYEFTLNLDLALRKAGVREQVDITFVTPEPYLGHFGHGGIGNSRQIIEDAFAEQGIIWQTEAQVTRVEPEAVLLAGHRRVASRFTMLVPPYRGIKPVRETPNLTDEDGRIPVDDYYSSRSYPKIFAAGVAVQVRPVVKTLLPCGVLVTGAMSAEMGRVAALNIAADLGHGEPVARPVHEIRAFYVLDSGLHGLLMSLGPHSWQKVQVNLPGPWSHWAKVMAEKYQMWQLQTGRF